MSRLKVALAAAAGLATVADMAIAGSLLALAVRRKPTVAPGVMTRLSSRPDVDARIRENHTRMREHTASVMAHHEPEVVGITSGDGLRLEADLYEPAAGSHRYAIVVHGYTGRRGDMRNYAARYLEEGYGVLAPDLRAHGASEGAFIGMGWPDRLDMLRWIAFLCERDPNALVVLHGVSMGAATVMMTSGEDLPPCVPAVIEDCGYTSVWDIFASELRVRYHLPKFPFLSTADLMARRIAGYSFREASAIAQVAKSTVPTFFIHGSCDDFVPCEMAFLLHDACSAPKELMVVDGAGHGQALSYDPETYFARVFAFIDARA